MDLTGRRFAQGSEATAFSVQGQIGRLSGFGFGGMDSGRCRFRVPEPGLQLHVLSGFWIAC